MAILNKTGITNGGTIQSEHVTRTIDALTGVSTDTIVATGSFTGSHIGTLTGNASTATTASYAISSEKDWMTLRLSTGLITGVTSGSTIYVGIGGVTGSSINRIGIPLPPYSCSIVSASVYCNAPVTTNTNLGSVKLMYDVLGTPATASNFNNIDPKTVYIDFDARAVNYPAAPTKWINLTFTPNATATGQFVISADIVIKKL
jgi:hypothetical protein